MSSQLPWTIENSMSQIVKLAEGRKIEHLRGFQARVGLNSSSILISEQVDAYPIVKVNRGANNSLFCGYRSQSSRLQVSFFGSNCSVYIGPMGRVAGDLQISGDNITVYIGAFTSISNITLTQWGDGTSFFVGDHCMLSARIIAGNTDSHPIFDKSTGTRINFDRDIRIDDRVWIARDVRINKGTHVRSGCVVGQGSIIGGVLEENCVYAGIPAKKLRENIVWSRQAAASLSELESSKRYLNQLRLEEEVLTHVNNTYQLDYEFNKVPNSIGVVQT